MNMLLRNFFFLTRITPLCFFLKKTQILVCAWQNEPLGSELRARGSQQSEFWLLERHLRVSPGLQLQEGVPGVLPHGCAGNEPCRSRAAPPELMSTRKRRL